MRPGFAALVLVALLPGANAALEDQSEWRAAAPATLYLHLDGTAPMAIDAYAPDPADEQDVTPGRTLPCAPAESGLATGDWTWRGLTSGNLAVANGSFEWTGQGFGADVIFDQSVTPTLHWYLLVGGGQGAQAVPGAPALTVAAELRASESLGFDDPGFDQGPTLALGSVSATVFAGHVQGGGGQVSPVRQVGDAWLYEFAVPLGLQADRIPRATGFTALIDVGLDVPQCQLAMGPFVAVHTDAGARPRIELAIQDGLAIEYLHPQWVGEELVVHAGFRAALGGVGLGIANATFEVLDEQGSVLFRSEPLASPPRTSTTFTPNWSWPPGESVPGEYSVRVSATTTEGSAKVEAHLTFEHQPEGSSPAPGPLLVALAVLAAIVSRRR